MQGDQPTQPKSVSPPPAPTEKKAAVKSNPLTKPKPVTIKTPAQKSSGSTVTVKPTTETKATISSTMTESEKRAARQAKFGGSGQVSGERQCWKKDISCNFCS